MKEDHSQLALARNIMVCRKPSILCIKHFINFRHTHANYLFDLSYSNLLTIFPVPQKVVLYPADKVGICLQKAGY